MEPGLPWEGEDSGLDTASLPSVVVRRDPARARPLPVTSSAVADLAVDLANGGQTSVLEVLGRSSTDAWVVLQSGAVVQEWYRPGAEPDDRRPLMSITKSVVGAVAGILIGQGLLREDEAVAAYLPELASSGYGGATLRDICDMRSGVHFREDYMDPASHIRAMDAAIAGTPGAVRGLHAFLALLEADRPHGGTFEYRSAEADVLGWVCERATGETIPDLVSRLIWGPMGAQYDAAFCTDVTGTAVYDGGLLATARDVARFGEVLLEGGIAGQHRIVPLDWIAQIWTVSPQLRAAFAESAAGPFLPGGWYRNQCWVLPGPHGDVVLGLGIHGQLLRVDPSTRTVIVKLSSWLAPQDPVQLHDTLRACDVVAAAVSGRAGRTGPRFGPGLGRIPPVSGR